MNDIIERRRRKPDYIETAQIAEHTAQKIALWCGGVVNRERDRGVDSYLELVVPNVEGNQKGHVNDYVVRKEDGRFYVMKPIDMGEYEVIGNRELSAQKRTDIEGALGLPGPKDSMGRAMPLTPHYAARNSPFANER